MEMPESFLHQLGGSWGAEDMPDPSHPPLLPPPKHPQDVVTVVVEDLRLCTVKRCPDHERRFCFEVVSPSKAATGEEVKKVKMAPGPPTIHVLPSAEPSRFV
ncbi:Arf-GAP with coiled-coil, ANK repeat and PH domain-containing protein 1, partial [Ophiophagus hannah]